MSRNALNNFFKMESSAGILLVLAAVGALVIANTPLGSVYDSVLSTRMYVGLGEFAVDKPLLLWINDGLMALFFLLIGLEVKREVLQGQLSSRDQIVLPAVGAAGGFIAPALIYAWINWDNPATIDGWAIPAATDIAFALGVLTLLGDRVPLSLKLFLTSVAIFDDIAAIVVIALFYTDELSVQSLVLAGIGLVGLLIMNKSGVKRLAPYMVLGTAIWICVLKSGVHATLAGFTVALFVPMKGKADDSPLLNLEHNLHPWVAFAILPIFAFSNAGVSFSGIDRDVAMGPVALGIAAGLFLGKQAGVFGAVWIAVKLGLARLPDNVRWLSIYGVALLTGIGFTMSLFIASLAFEHGAFDQAVAARVGVLAGSILSGTIGVLILRMSLMARDNN